MKTRRSLPGAGVYIASLALLALMLAGCATKPVDWDARIGHYTYDRAVADYRLPDRQIPLVNGNTVAEWIFPRSGGGATIDSGVDFFGDQSTGGTANTGSGDKVLRLTFAPDGKLLSWSKNY